MDMIQIRIMAEKKCILSCILWTFVHVSKIKGPFFSCPWCIGSMVLTRYFYIFTYCLFFSADGMTSATQFTYETILKFHNNRHAAKTGKLQQAPIDVPESAVQKRNFQPNLEQAQREQNKAQADIGKVNAMQMYIL